MLLTFYVLASVFLHTDVYYKVSETQHGFATTYYPGDGHSGEVCADGQSFTVDRCHIAHRTWPLGSRVRVCHKKRCIITFVGDRGPYGACDKQGKKRTNGFVCKGRWFVKVRLKHGWLIRHPGDQEWTRVNTAPEGQWRGVADMSRCVQRRLRSPGVAVITLHRLKLRTSERVRQRLLNLLRLGR